MALAISSKRVMDHIMLERNNGISGKRKKTLILTGSVCEGVHGGCEYLDESEELLNSLIIMCHVGPAFLCVFALVKGLLLEV
jgi:hypothetical protein